MKHLKTLGLVTVVAAAQMAIVGTGTASATVLCKTAPVNGECATGWAYTGEIHAVSEEAPTITTSVKTVECDESTISGVPDSEGDETSPVRVPLSTLTMKAFCNCTVVVGQTGALEIHSIGGSGSGTITSNGATITFNCSTIFGTVHCNYVTENDDLGTLAGGTTATISITAGIGRETTSSICDAEAIWHAKYKITTPDSLWVTTKTGDV